MADWNQLEKDLEAVKAPWTWEDYTEEDGKPRFFVIPADHHGTVCEVNSLPLARFLGEAPDLAALALAGKRLADAVQHEREMVCQDFDMQLKTVQATDAALTAFRKAEGESHE